MIFIQLGHFLSHMTMYFRKKINLQQKVIKLKLNPYILHQKIISTNKITTGYCLPSDDLPHPIILVYYISTHQCIVYLSQLVILYISLSSFYKTLHLQFPYQIYWIYYILYGGLNYSLMKFVGQQIYVYQVECLLHENDLIQYVMLFVSCQHIYIQYRVHTVYVLYLLNIFFTGDKLLLVCINYLITFII